MTDQQDREWHFLDYWRLLVKRRWVIYTSLIVVVSTVTLGTLLMRPVYTATTRLQIEQNSPKVQPFQEVWSTVPNNYRNDFYETQYNLIRSRRVAGEVIDSLNLARHDDFRFDDEPRERPGMDVEEILEAMRINMFLTKLEVAPVRNSRLVDILFSSHDPALAARVANRVAETYIAFNSEVQYNTTTRATTSLAHEIANLQEQIDATQEEFQAYAREHGIVALSEKQNIALKNLNDLSDAYTAARAERIEKEARYAALRDTGSSDIPEALQSQLIKELAARSAELSQRRAQLSEKYKPDWPEMVRLDREIQASRERLELERRALYEQVKGAAEGAYRAARIEQQQLKEALDEQKRLTQDLSLKEIQYNNLKAEIANRRETLDALLRRQAETSATAGLNDLVASNVRIVDVAEVPMSKSSPHTLRSIALGLFTGLVLGVGLAFFFDYLDRSVKSPEEMHRATGIPSIGLIPALRPERAGLRIIRANSREVRQGAVVDLISHQDPKSKVAEAFRDLRTALLVSRAGGPPRKILIASAQPGDGKTIVAVNLAITLAQMGRRVLLVDADLRKPRLHKIFGMTCERGLSSHLSGADAPWPEPAGTIIQGLDVIPSGPLPPNPADLLDSERFAQLLGEFEEHGYDHVICDSPPVLVVADAAIMAGRMDAVVIVVRAGVTSRDAAAHAVRRLQQVKSRIVGAVLNRADLDQQAYYYGYSYKQYYGEEETSAAPPASDEKRRGPTAQG